jgi:hypothetical protein
MPPKLKQIHIKVPQEIYEAFYRKHPGRGERTKFLLSKICEDISQKYCSWEDINETKKP